LGTKLRNLALLSHLFLNSFSQIVFQNLDPTATTAATAAAAATAEPEAKGNISPSSPASCNGGCSSGPSNPTQPTAAATTTSVPHKEPVNRSCSQAAAAPKTAATSPDCGHPTATANAHLLNQPFQG